MKVLKSLFKNYAFIFSNHMLLIICITHHTVVLILAASEIFTVRSVFASSPALLGFKSMIIATPIAHHYPCAKRDLAHFTFTRVPRQRFSI